MGSQEPISLAELLERLAAERALRLTDAQAVYKGICVYNDSKVLQELSTIKQTLECLPGALREQIAEDVQTLLSDIVLPKVDGVPEQTADLLSGSMSTQNAVVVEKITEVNTAIANVKIEVGKVPELLTNLDTSIASKLDSVKSGIDGSIAQLNSVIGNVETQLGVSLQKLNTDLASTTSDVKLAVLDSMRAMNEGISSNLKQLKEGTEQQLANLNSSLSASIENVETLIDDPTNGLLPKLKAANASIDNCIVRLSKMVSDIENSDSITDIRNKVSAYYDCYGQLLSNLMLLETQCVTSYKDWMDEASKAALRQLDVADTLEQVSIRIAALNEHEDKLNYIIGQFDKMTILASNIGALAALWESDHDVIQQFNAIVKSQKTFNSTLAAANIGTALSGVAAVANAAKTITTKEKPKEVV